MYTFFIYLLFMIIIVVVAVVIVVVAIVVSFSIIVIINIHLYMNCQHSFILSQQFSYSDFLSHVYSGYQKYSNWH